MDSAVPILPWQSVSRRITGYVLTEVIVPEIIEVEKAS